VNDEEDEKTVQKPIWLQEDKDAKPPRERQRFSLPPIASSELSPTILKSSSFDFSGRTITAPLWFSKPEKIESTNNGLLSSSPPLSSTRSLQSSGSSRERERRRSLATSASTTSINNSL